MIDDDGLNVAVYQSMLKIKGLKADKAMNGVMGLRFIEKRLQICSVPMYKLLILDYSMVGMDGPQFMVELRKGFKKIGLEMPFVCCCSAYVEESYKEKALSTGMDMYLSKPFNVKQLEEVLKRAKLI